MWQWLYASSKDDGVWISGTYTYECCGAVIIIIIMEEIQKVYLKKIGEKWMPK